MEQGIYAYTTVSAAYDVGVWLRSQGKSTLNVHWKPAKDSWPMFMLLDILFIAYIYI